MGKISSEKIINKTFLKANLPEVERRVYRDSLKKLKENLNVNETEEHNKNIIRDFLMTIGYSDDKTSVNTSGNIDLTISKKHENYVLIETKSLSNPEMISQNNLNKKAFHELLLYFMRERIVEKNYKLTYLIITDGFEWFIFDATLFNNLFVKNKTFVEEFRNADLSKSIVESTTLAFYNNIAKPAIDKVIEEIDYVHFDIRNVFYKNNEIKESRADEIIKILSPITLFKQTYISDNNSLNKNFYDELLYIMGLQETEKENKIQRLPEDKRKDGSIIELIYFAMETSDYRFRNEEEKFDIAINLTNAWVNRILFLKLVEQQLIKFNGNDDIFSFVNKDKIPSFNTLNELFFGVLAKPKAKRGKLEKKYKNVPYLNSSLFEKNEAEQATDITPSNLYDDMELSLYKKSILKDSVSQKVKSLNSLHYLLDFLNSYSFNSDHSATMDHDTISTAVLGLIFEKINGYKDGSYYTPGFVTSYMAKKTIDKSLLNKFKNNGFSIDTLKELQTYTDKEDRIKIEKILNDFKLIDPAVGSGHFLVSALNYLVKIRYDLDLLSPRLLTNYNIFIENDELIVANTVLDEYFEYRRGVDRLTEIQEDLFATKLNIIENNLFGVDINKNSVNISRLRIWIELLKNSYYTDEGELRVMPNLEMNIKTGNSLVSKFDLSSNLGDISRRTDVTVKEFKKLVHQYKNIHDKYAKQEIEENIRKFKNTMIDVMYNSNDFVRLNEKHQELYSITQTITLLSTPEEKRVNDNRVSELREEIINLENKISEAKKAVIFDNSFEWRFEFPEVLNDKGKFNGFDLVIANPPYIGMQANKKIFDEVALTNLGSKYSSGKMDYFYYFIHLSIDLLVKDGILGFITTNYWLAATDANKLRNDLRDRTVIHNLENFNNLKIFSSATGQHNLITIAEKSNRKLDVSVLITTEEGYADSEKFNEIVNSNNSNTRYNYISNKSLFNSISGNINLEIGLNSNVDDLMNKLISRGETLDNYAKFPLGITTGSNDVFLVEQEEFNSIAFNDYEKKILKPLINGSSLQTYFETEIFDSWIAYIDKDVEKEKIPNLIKRISKKKLKLESRREVVSGSRRWFDIHWPRESSWLDSDKTIYVQKRAKIPFFTMNNNRYYIKDDAYAVTIRKKEGITPEILMVLLNSTLVHFMLAYNGRLKGNTLEMYPGALNTILVPLIDKMDVEEVFSIIEKMKKHNLNFNSSIKKEIDLVVNGWFEITSKEFEIAKDFINTKQNLNI